MEFWVKISKRRKSLKNMEPMSGLEPLTYALLMRMRMEMQLIDVTVIADTVVCYRAYRLSYQFPFV
jgi:hypothetical protein